MIGDHASADDVVIVEATIHRCGCTTATTHAGYLAEARFCPAGLRLAEDLVRARDTLSRLDFDDERFGGRLLALEAKEKGLISHRSAAGVAARAVRPFDPRNATGGRPKPTPVRLEETSP